MKKTAFCALTAALALLLLLLPACARKAPTLKGGTLVTDENEIAAIDARLDASAGIVYVKKVTFNPPSADFVYRFENERFDGSKEAVEEDGVKIVFEGYNGAGDGICVNDKRDYDDLKALFPALSYTEKAPEGADTGDVLASVRFVKGNDVTSYTVFHDGTVRLYVYSGGAEKYAAIDEPSLARLALMKIKYTGISVDLLAAYEGKLTLGVTDWEITLDEERSKSLISGVFGDGAAAGTLYVNETGLFDPENCIRIGLNDGSGNTLWLSKDGRLYVVREPIAGSLATTRCSIVIYAAAVWQSSGTFSYMDVENAALSAQQDA